MTILVERARAALSERAGQSLLRNKSKSVATLATTVEFENQSYINFSSNDYLGLGADFAVQDIASNKPSSGATSSPLVVGDGPSHARLEAQVRSFLAVPETHGMLFFSSGYAANQAVLNTVFDGLLKNGLLLQDKLNHASLLECGKRLHLAKFAKQKRFKHNDLSNLKTHLTADALVVTEGVFSMDGDEAPLAEMSRLCKASKALLMVDDAHGLGFEISSLHRAGLEFDEVDFYIGTFGKAIGAQGAVLIAKRELIDYFINFCKEYIYSTHLSPLQTEAISHNIGSLQSESLQSGRVEKLKENIHSFRKLASAKGIKLCESKSAIQPIIVGCEQRAIEVSQALRKEGIWLNAMRYPTVPKGQSRLRVTLTSKHSLNEISRLVELLANFLRTPYVLPEKVASQFGQSANTYKTNAQLQYKSGLALLEALQSRCSPEQMTSNNIIGLDLGCGPGLYTKSLEERAKTIINLDLSQGMLSSLETVQPKVCADSHKLPLLSNSVNWVYSNLMIQWCDIASVLSEIHRVLKPGGVAVISTLLPGSLYELELAWNAVDRDRHTHQYQSAKEINQALGQLPWEQVEVTDSSVTYWFENAVKLARELKGLGANYVSKRCQKGLTGKAKWAALEESYRKQFFDATRNAIPATYQLRTLILTKSKHNND